MKETIYKLANELFVVMKKSQVDDVDYHHFIGNGYYYLSICGLPKSEYQLFFDDHINCSREIDSMASKDWECENCDSRGISLASTNKNRGFDLEISEVETKIGEDLLLQMMKGLRDDLILQINNKISKNRKKIEKAKMKITKLDDLVKSLNNREN